MNETKDLARRAALLVWVLAGAWLLSATAAAQQPNIVIIQADDLDLELGSIEYMPYLQLLLVGGGTSFQNAIVPLSLCCPSRATLLTGQYAQNHQVYTNGGETGGYERFFTLGLEESTVAVALEAAGYRTVLLGKYLNGYPLTEDPLHVPQGWTEWYSPVSGNPYSNFNYVMNENGTPVLYQDDEDDYLTDVISEKASAFIVGASNAGDPFFVYLAPYAPHWPATPAPRHENLFPGVHAPRTPSFNEEDVSDKPSFIADLPPLNLRQIAAIDDQHRTRLQSLQAVDEMIASLVVTLQVTGQLENTYVIFTSDNGYHLGQHRLQAGKYYGYEKDLRVPLLVRGPGVTPGSSVSALASEVDLVPTFAELAGASLLLASDGRSLAPLLASPTPPDDWRQILFFEEYPLAGQEPEQPADGTLEPPDADAVEAGLRFNGLTTASYKYVEYESGEREYYDLVADPDELENQYAVMDPGLRNQLEQALANLVGCAAEACRSADGTPIFAPAPAAVDAHAGSGTSSNLNSILEPGETVAVAPSWTNTGTAPYALTGAASEFGGPEGAIYTLVDSSADYGSIPGGETANCQSATGDCYVLGVSVPQVRPAPHWDATYVETLGTGYVRTWPVHIGNSFGDVSVADPFYPFIETLLHLGVTSGCGEGVYCPEASITRAEMAAFLLKSALGAGYTPPPAMGIFDDVPAGDPFAPWIEELFRRGITAGCGENLFCPNDPVTRATMSALLLKTFLGPAYEPPPAAGIFDDVPQEDPFAPWIEDLFARGITAGCQAQPPLYCPDAPNTRQEMAVFLVKTFGLFL